MIKQIIGIIIPFSLLHLHALSQVVVGKVYNENAKPLELVSLTLHKKNQSAILAFAISDKEGRFEVKYTPTNSDTLELKASLLGYGKQSVFFVPGERTEFNFILSPQAITLPTVTTKAPPVWQRKDTINYNISEFKQQQDRVIGDIIARLPGIEVSPGGQIKYNGRPINKYYIEGLDLLEDRYGIANNNIPADAVEKVQVLENHQPIRVLDSVSFSDRAALNIKLKNSSKAKLLGRAKLGIGASPLLAEDEIMAMLFKKKLQFINTYKYNNTGLDNTRELTAQNISEYINGLQNGAVKADLVSLIQPTPPAIRKQRYLFNNSHLATVNQLFPLNSIYQLRINASYVNDFQKQQNSSYTKIYLPTDTILIAEQNKTRVFQNILQTDISLLANSPKYYLKNLLHFQAWRQQENGFLQAAGNINQQLSNPFYNLSNDFRLLKTKQKHIAEWGSYIGFVSLPQSLVINPGLYQQTLNNNVPFDGLLQETNLKTYFTDNYFSIRKRVKKIGGQYKFGFNIQAQDFLTNLLIQKSGSQQSISDSFQNNLQWRRYKIYNENNWNYETDKWRLSVSLPVNYTAINYNDPLLKIKEEKKGFFISPGFSAIYQLSPRSNFNFSASYIQGIGDLTNISGGYILKTYRNLSNNNAPLPETESLNFSGSITFRNPLKIIFFNNGISYSVNKSNLLYSQQFTGNLETLIAILQNNYNRRLSLFGRFNKYFIDWKTTIGFNYNYSFGSQQQLQQNRLVTFRNTNYSIGANIGIKFSPKLAADYSGTYFNYSSKGQLQKSSSTISSATQQLNLNYYPTEKLILKLASEYYYVNTNLAPASNYYFMDFVLRYKPQKSKVDYELGVQNIFNTNSFTTAMLINNIESYSSYQLRPRQLLFKVSFSF
jgi:hypothetical protein